MDIRHRQKSNKIEFLTQAEVECELRGMINDVRFNTATVSARDADNTIKKIDFYKKHSTYLSTHPKVDPEKYLLNLRTMTRIRH